MFYNFLGAYTLLTGLPMLFEWLPSGWSALLAAFTGWGAVVSGIAAIWFMHRIYRIPARPFWDHWQVLTSFCGTMLALGPLLVALVYIGVQTASGNSWSDAANMLAKIILAGILIETTGLYIHQRDLVANGGEGSASHYEQVTKFGKTYAARNAGFLVSAILLTVYLLIDIESVTCIALWIYTATVIVLTALTGRALFYALVIPTTMPGAFFWRNRGFEEHARETGLADMPQVGVLPNHALIGNSCSDLSEIPGQPDAGPEEFVQPDIPGIAHRVVTDRQVIPGIGGELGIFKEEI